MKITLPPVLAATVMLTLAGGASAQTGPVARACHREIASFCARLPHNGSVRVCLQRHYRRLSHHCRVALDTTGRGHRHWGRPRH